MSIDEVGCLVGRDYLWRMGGLGECNRLLLAGTNANDTDVGCVDCECIATLIDGGVSALFHIDEGFAIVFFDGVALFVMFVFE